MKQKFFPGLMCFFFPFLFLSFFWSPPGLLGQDKLRHATNAMTVLQYLPVYATENQGFWKKYGLDVQWSVLRGATVQMQAMVAGHVDMGSATAVAAISGIGRGVPLVISMSIGDQDFFLWVPTKSRIATAADLKGGRVAVTSLSGVIYAFGRAAVDALGLSKDVKFVATGGPRESLAAFRAGTVDGIVTTIPTMLKLKLAGEARELVSIQEYLPKEWAGDVLFPKKSLMAEKPDVVRRAGLGLRDALSFIVANPAWAAEAIKAAFGLNDPEAKLILEKAIRLTPDGKITRKQVENVRDFLVQYGLVPKEKMPPAETFYAPIF